MRSARVIWTIIVAGLVGNTSAIAADAPGQSLSASLSGAGGCVTLNGSLQGALLFAQAGTPAAVPDEGQRHRPMVEQELRQMIDFLSLLAAEPRERGESLRAVETRMRALPPDRLGVLVVDSSALLARMHLEETIRELRRSPKVDRSVIAWGERATAMLDSCLRERYAPFGGEPAFREASRLVLRNRAALEKVIIGNALAQARPPKAGAP